MATFRFIHAGSGLPLHIDGLGDKLASVRYGDCRDDFSLFWVEPAGGKAVFIRNFATEMPLHINGFGDKLASVRCGECLDDFSRFVFEAAPAFPDVVIRNVAMTWPLHIDASCDKLASSRYAEGDAETTHFRLEVSFAIQPCLLVHSLTQRPLRVDGLGDQLAYARDGDPHDDNCHYHLEPSAEGSFFLVHLESGWPLHVNGLDDHLLSVRFGDCRDDFARFEILASPEHIGRFTLHSVATGGSLYLRTDEKMACTEDEGSPASVFWMPLRKRPHETEKPDEPKKVKGARIPAGYEMVGTGPLGSGGFGVVHCCRCLLDQRLCAVKTIYQPFTEDEAFLRRELENLAALPPHPNLVRYYTSFLDQGILHIVTEYVDSLKLYKLIRDSNAEPCPAESVQSWFLQLFRGLSCMHSIGMIHRDLHAENVLIARDAQGIARNAPDSVKIIDVGLAKIYETLEPAVMSVHGVGPAWYFSPERRRGEGFDSLDDVWAAGCMMAEMIVCRGRYIQKHPNHGPGGIDFSLKPEAVEELLRLCQDSAGLRKRLGGAARSALAPKDRRSTAQELAEELAELGEAEVSELAGLRLGNIPN